MLPRRGAPAEGDEAARLRRAAELPVRVVVRNRADALVADHEFVHLEPPARRRVRELRDAYGKGIRSVIGAGNAGGGAATIAQPASEADSPREASGHIRPR